MHNDVEVKSEEAHVGRLNLRIPIEVSGQCRERGCEKPVASMRSRTAINTSVLCACVSVVLNVHTPLYLSHCLLV